MGEGNIGKDKSMGNPVIKWEVDEATLSRILDETETNKPGSVGDKDEARRIWKERLEDLHNARELKLVVDDKRGIKSLEALESETYGEGLDFDVALGLLGVPDRHEYVFDAMSDSKIFGKNLEKLLGKPVRIEKIS